MLSEREWVEEGRGDQGKAHCGSNQHIVGRFNASHTSTESDLKSKIYGNCGLQFDTVSIQAACQDERATVPA